MTVDPRALIKAARVPLDAPDWIDGNRNCRRMAFHAAADLVGFPSMMVLSEANMHGLHMVDDQGWGGHIIMEDSARELRKHLPILIHGTGRILKTGLGLGCVVRGLLSKPDVAHIDVIENDPRIIKHVGPEFAADPRVTIWEGDALSIDVPGRWDFAWHDIYTEGNDGLELKHGELIARFMGRAAVQGAWGLPRIVSRFGDVRLLGLPKQKHRRAA